MAKWLIPTFLFRIQHIRCELVKFEIYVILKKEGGSKTFKMIHYYLFFKCADYYQNSIKKLMKTVIVGTSYIKKLEEYYVNLLFF